MKVNAECILCELVGHEKEVYALDFSPDGRSGSDDDTVVIRDMGNVPPKVRMFLWRRGQANGERS